MSVQLFYTFVKFHGAVAALCLQQLEHLYFSLSGISTLFNYFKPLQSSSSPFTLYLPLFLVSPQSFSLSLVETSVVYQFSSSLLLRPDVRDGGSRPGGLLSLTDHLLQGLGDSSLSLRQAHTGQHHDNRANVCRGDER